MVTWCLTTLIVLSKRLRVIDKQRSLREWIEWPRIIIWNIKTTSSLSRTRNYLWQDISKSFLWIKSLDPFPGSFWSVTDHGWLGLPRHNAQLWGWEHGMPIFVSSKKNGPKLIAKKKRWLLSWHQESTNLVSKVISLFVPSLAFCHYRSNTEPWFPAHSQWDPVCLEHDLHSGVPKFRALAITLWLNLFYSENTCFHMKRLRAHHWLFCLPMSVLFIV